MLQFQDSPKLFTVNASNRQVFSYVQQHQAHIDEVFPLLCPERETEWITGWTYEWVFSKSGFIEGGCVFTTPFNDSRSVWVVSNYDKTNHKIQFVKFSPGAYVAVIDITLYAKSPVGCCTHISYTFTALHSEFRKILENDFQKSFEEKMKSWESAINAYLK